MLQRSGPRLKRILSTSIHHHCHHQYNNQAALLLRSKSHNLLSSSNLNASTPFFRSTHSSSSSQMASHSHPHSHLPVPHSAWDSHMHVTDPANFPPSAGATYSPHPALLPAALANAERLNLPNLVLVQPSTYGTDNSCLLSALRTLGPDRARGVVVVDPEDRSKGARDRLVEWHALGVRGVRVNAKSVAKKVEGEAEEEGWARRAAESEALGRALLAHVRCLKALGRHGWAVQVYADMALIGPVLEDVARELGGEGRTTTTTTTATTEGKGMEHKDHDDNAAAIKLVLDHLGTPSRAEVSSGKTLAECDGGAVLQRVMQQNEHVFVKVSAPYRMASSTSNKNDKNDKNSNDKAAAAIGGWGPLEALTKEFLALRGGRGVVFASDWPHTRFKGVDVLPWVENCVEWCGEDEGLRDRLFRDNARVLWDV